MNFGLPEKEKDELEVQRPDISSVDLWNSLVVNEDIWCETQHWREINGKELHRKEISGKSNGRSMVVPKQKWNTRNRKRNHKQEKGKEKTSTRLGVKRRHQQTIGTIKRRQEEHSQGRRSQWNPHGCQKSILEHYCLDHRSYKQITGLYFWSQNRSSITATTSLSMVLIFLWPIFNF